MYSKTEAGQNAFKVRSPLFSARQRSAFLLFDGIKSVSQVLQATSGLGIAQVDIDHLVQQGFLVPLPSSPVPNVKEFPQAEPPVGGVKIRTRQERYNAAMPIATKLTASLGLRGFRLNLAVESTSRFEDLVALLPKIQVALGTKPCVPLVRALKT